MAESQGAAKLMLNPREKLTGALVIGIAFATFVATLVVTAIFAVPEMSKPPPGDYYPDIVKEDMCSTCWEATVFATSSDPFYQWVSDSSLPDALDVSQRGTLAYQRASIWRVSGNITSTNESSLYSSPDPHILGGEFVKISRTLVWKMTVYWGMSVRTCFTLPGSKDDSCLYTTPIVQTAPGSYAALLVGVPYRKASQEPYAVESSALYLDNSAVYLTNFVSNARTGAGLKLKSSGKGIKNYVYEGQVCNRASPILVTPDVVSYMGFPSFQCACDGNLCLVGLDFTGTASNEDDIFPLKLNASGCGQGNSFWDYDIYPLEENRTIFYSYSPTWNTSILLQVNFSIRFNWVIFGAEDTIQRLKDFVSCTEHTIQKKAPNDTTLVADLKECLRDPIVAVSPPFGRTSAVGRHQSRASLEVLMDTFNNKVPSDKDDNFLCGMDEGQSKLVDKLCTMQKLEKRLRESQKVADVLRFVKKEWESTSSQRSDITVGIVTAVVTILVTIWGMFNRDLQEVEALILKRAGKFTRVVEATIGLPLFKTGIRGFLLLGVIVWNMFNVFVSLNAVGSEPRLATSKTLLQQLDGVSFLVTTTSTVQVTPSWIILFAACSFAIFVFAIVTFGVYVRMRYVERKEKIELFFSLERKEEVTVPA
ncbi:hypothetical protein SELMODRAFT_404657 [Selaginella moellendorffii]|uniref:Uncharacterized protein n=1 Tax=Selaginella moellendorffii TaxID=88036 RepID=D8QW04_SELML|nr:hypothetical protein SELMODRAFT_404657 [Selaginella moellendorffii]